MGTIRQAIVIVHGMGEQRPLETLKRFIKIALPNRLYFSRPDKVTDSYESRRYVMRSDDDEDFYGKKTPGEGFPQTEVYEYHWAHMMQGNRLNDLWSTFRRMIFTVQFPKGLWFVWLLTWCIIIWAVWAFLHGPFYDISLPDVTIAALIQTLLGSGFVAVVLTFLITVVLPRWLTTNFVDVVRYLDTSPRSLDVRSRIRKGMVDLLQGLHDSGRYHRIIVVAHSLGGYIAYDGITYLWPRMNKFHKGPIVDDPDIEPVQPKGLKELEEAAGKLIYDVMQNNGSINQRLWNKADKKDKNIVDFREAQKNLWLGLRDAGNPWIITDFITLGTPMYMADRLLTKKRKQFDEAVLEREIQTCPPISDPYTKNNINETICWYSWNNRGRRVVYHAAPFAVVRWTNMWFPAVWNFLGDWFGGPLERLYGPGVMDVPLNNKGKIGRWLPGWAHTRYFSYPDDRSTDSAAIKLQEAMDLAASEWLKKTVYSPSPLPETDETA